MRHRVFYVSVVCLLAACGSANSTGLPRSHPPTATAQLSPSSSDLGTPSAFSRPTLDLLPTSGWQTVGESQWEWQLSLPADAIALTATDATKPSVVSALKKRNPERADWIDSVVKSYASSPTTRLRAWIPECGTVSMVLHTMEYADASYSLAAVEEKSRLDWAEAGGSLATFSRVALPSGEAIRRDGQVIGIEYLIPTQVDVWQLFELPITDDLAKPALVLDTIATTYHSEP